VNVRGRGGETGGVWPNMNSICVNC